MIDTDPTPIELAPSMEAVRRGQIKALEDQLALRTVYSQQLATENLRLRDLLLSHGISPDAGLLRETLANEERQGTDASPA